MALYTTNKTIYIVMPQHNDRYLMAQAKSIGSIVLLSDMAMSLRIVGIMLNVDGIEYKHNLMIMIDKINQTLTCYYAGMSRFAGVVLDLNDWSCNDRLIGTNTDSPNQN